MGGALVVLLLLLLGGGVFLFLYMSRSNTPAGAETPVPKAPAESVHHSDDFIPQETIYSYHNSTPGISCPNCDAENPSGMTFCQVCGAKLDNTKFT